MSRDRYITATEAREPLGGVSKQRVHELCDLGILKYKYEEHGRRRIRYVSTNSIDRYMNSRPTDRRGGRPKKAVAA